MKKLLLISLIVLSGCTRIAHIGEAGDIVIDRPDLYTATAKLHEEYHQQDLGHCWNGKCVMFFWELRSLELCPKCKTKLKKIKARKPTTLDWLKDIEVK